MRKTKPAALRGFRAPAAAGGAPGGAPRPLALFFLLGAFRAPGRKKSRFRMIGSGVIIEMVVGGSLPGRHKIRIGSMRLAWTKRARA